MSERVLVVDACEDARWAIARTLEAWGLEVLEAADADGARAATSHVSPAAALIDLRLAAPAALANALRLGGAIGIGLLSTLPQDWVEDRVDLSAFDLFVPKPLRPEALAGAARFLLLHAHARRGGARTLRPTAIGPVRHASRGSRRRYTAAATRAASGERHRSR